MNKKGILLVGNYPLPYGGVPAHLQYLASYLKEKKWDVYILSGGYPKGLQYKNGISIYKSNKIDIIPNIPSLLRELPKITKFKSYALDHPKIFLSDLGLICIIKKIIKDKVSIISAYHILRQGFIGALLSEELSIPLVTTNFGEIYQRPSFYQTRIAEVDYVCKISKKLLSVSQHCAKSYNLLGRSHNVEVIPVGIDVAKFSPAIEETKIRQKYKIDSKDKVILFMGRMLKDMGLHTVIDAIPQVLKVKNKIRFIIAGAKLDLFKSAIQLSENYKENVFVAPNVPFEDQPFYYAASNIVIAPTLDNRACMGLAIKEAMASGKTVIASNIGGVPEAVVDKETGILIPPDDPNALAEAIMKLADDNESLLRMSVNGRERAMELFDKNKNNQKIEQIFRNIGGI